MTFGRKLEIVSDPNATGVTVEIERTPEEIPANAKRAAKPPQDWNKIARERAAQAGQDPEALAAYWKVRNAVEWNEPLPDEPPGSPEWEAKQAKKYAIAISERYAHCTLDELRRLNRPWHRILIAIGEACGVPGDAPLVPALQSKGLPLDVQKPVVIASMGL